MNQTSTNRINLPIVKHHFTLANSRDVDRENCVSSRLRTQDRGQLADWRNGCDCLGITTVYSDRDHATTSRSTSIVLATSLTYLSLIHISEPTRLLSISYAVFCLKKK